MSRVIRALGPSDHCLEVKLPYTPTLSNDKNLYLGGQCQCSCDWSFMSETINPLDDISGINFSSSVVLPIPE